MLDIRYIVGSLIISVAVLAFLASLILPIDRSPNANASLKPRIEPSRIAEPAPAPAPAPAAMPAPKQVIAPPAATPASKQAVAPAVQPAQPKAAAAPAAAPSPSGPKQPIAQAQPLAPETTGSVGEKKPAAKPAPRRVVQPKKEEPAFQFPWFKGFGQQ